MAQFSLYAHKVGPNYICPIVGMNIFINISYFCPFSFLLIRMMAVLRRPPQQWSISTFEQFGALHNIMRIPQVSMTIHHRGLKTVT